MAGGMVAAQVSHARMVVQPDFNPKTWKAFQRFGVDGVPAGRVAEELGMTENAVILAKSRVLKRLREEAGDLLG